MTPKERFNEILNIYNYYNMAIIVNEKGVIEYFFNNRPDINSLTEQDILGHNILAVSYTHLDVYKRQA